MRLRQGVRRRVFDVAVIGGFVFASLYVTARIGLGPRDPARGVGVIFAPWTSGEAALRRAVGAGAGSLGSGGRSKVARPIPVRGCYLTPGWPGGRRLVVLARPLAAGPALATPNQYAD